MARAMLERLGADKALRARVITLIELHGRPAAYDASWTDSAVRRLGLDAGDAWDDLLDLAAADVTSGRERKRQEAARRVAGLRAHADRLAAEASLAELESPLDGNDLMRLFTRPPGPWIKALKAYLREAVIDGRLQPGDRAAAEVMSRDYLAGNEVPGSG
jgi:poly(A) polymerase